MISTTTLFNKALLAEASYADFRTAEQIDRTYDKDKVKAALKIGGFSAIQTDEFAQHWQVVSHQPDTKSGFSATLFKNIQTGEYVFANRGTAGLFEDILLADIFGIVLQGKATEQIIDMYRYFRTLETAKGDPVVYSASEIALLKEFAGLSNLDVIALENGLLTDIGEGAITSATSVTVVGHSLGGHLSTWFEAFFANRTNHVYTFNGAGIGGFGVEIVDLLTQAFRDGKMFSLSNSDITNVYAEQGLEVTAGTGTYVGSMLPVFIEDQGLIAGNLLIANHSISHLTNALALYRIVNMVDASLNLIQIKTILEAGSNKPEESLEAIASALGDLLNVGTTVGIDIRDELYGRLKAIEMALYVDPYAVTPILKPEYQNLQIVDVASLADSAILDTSEGLAYRYALKQLNPFAILGIDYNPHNANGELDLYDAASGEGTITEQWMADRAQMLAHMLLRNTEDSDAIVDVGRNEAYYDMATGQMFSDVGAELPPDSKHIIFGDPNANLNILGGTQNDHLYGDGGDDLITGGKGNDYLEGGADSDIYVVLTGEGMDTILDIDGLGKITLDGVQIKGRTGVDSNWLQTGSTWHDQQNHLSYALVTNSSGAQDLIIASANNTLIVKNWHENQLGITLGTSQVASPSIEHTIVGDLKPLNQGTNEGGMLLGYDNLGNVLVDPNQAGPNRQDTLYDSSDNDQLQGLGGDDILDAKRGGDDSLEGGVGNDVMMGGSGKDYLFAEEKMDWATAEVSSLTQASTGLRGDWLDGGDGNDKLLGEGGHDLLAGGDGTDILLGGGGDDNLYGDETGSAGLNWSVTRQVSTTDNVETHWSSFSNGGILDNGVGAADTIYGGLGNDWLYGNQGKDLLDGGGDDDVAFGGEGADIILGGDGNDVLIGNADYYMPLGDGTDYMDGGAGDDRLLGGGGDDILFGGLDNDVLAGDHNGTSAQDEGEDSLDGGEGNDRLLGGGNNDTLLGGIGTDYLYGEFGNDWLFGGADNDQLSGGADIDYLDGGTGNDIVDGGAGNDTLLGGAGVDILQGGAGDDSYVDLTADDTVIDTQGNNVIRLNQAAGLAADNAFSKGDSYGVNLKLALDNGEILTFNNALFGMSATLVFAGGAEIDLETLVGNSLKTSVNLQLGNSGGTIYGGANADMLSGGDGEDLLSGALGEDKLYGHDGDDRLSGGGGNDILDAGNDDDIIIGGSGHDLLLGGAGNDLYQLDVTADKDLIADTQGENIIRFGVLNSAELSASVSTLAGQQVLTLKLNGGELATITQGYTSFSFEFADGLLLTVNEFLLDYGAQAITQQGTDTDDVLFGSPLADNLFGYAGKDTLWGGRGDDQLDGGSGADVYHYRLGDGHDTIYDMDANPSQNDRITFGQGISLDDVVFNRSPNGDLLITVAGVNDAIRVVGWYLDNANRVESFVFDNGQVILADGLWMSDVTPQIGTNYADELVGTDYHDILKAGAGADRLIGNAGDDDLYGEEGTDSYFFAMDGGSDTIFEKPNETSIIEINDYDLSRLIGTRIGNDLLLKVTDSADSLTLHDYYTMPHDWQVMNRSGTIQALNTLLSNNDAYRASQNELEQLKATFIAQISDSIIQLYQSTGMEQQADGLWISDVQQITTSKITENYFRASGYTGIIPVNNETYSLTGGLGFLSSGFSISRYSSDDINIEYVNNTSSYRLKSNVIVNWNEAKKTTTNSELYAIGAGHHLYTENEALVLITTFGVNSIENPYVFDQIPAYTLINQTTSKIATVLSVRDNDGSGYDIATADPRTFYNLDNLPNTLAINGYRNNASIDIISGGNSSNSIYFYGEFGVLQGSDGNDIVFANILNFYLDNNVILGQALLDGGLGNDLMIGGNSNDKLIGSRDNDVLRGEGGADQYYFFAGDIGTDLVYDVGYGGDLDHDTVVFGQGITLSNITYSWGYEVLPSYSFGQYDESRVRMFQTLDINWQVGSVARVVMSTPFKNSYGQIVENNDWEQTGIEFFEFADGTRITMAQLLASSGVPVRPVVDRFSTILMGTTQADQLTGQAGSDDIYAGLGNDTLMGADGDDWLFGGAGNDQLLGGSGNDRYYFDTEDTGADLLFDMGYGSSDIGYGGSDAGYGGAVGDTVVFGQGINLSDFSFSWDSETVSPFNDGNLTLFQTLNISWQAGSAIKIVMPRSDDYVGLNTGVEFFEFSDGSRMTMAQMLTLAGTSSQHAPILNIPLTNQVAVVDRQFSYTLPADAFVDADVGELLIYSYSSDLEWLYFNSVTRTFSGIPTADSLGSTDIFVTVKDRFGASVSDTFTLTVNFFNSIVGTAGHDTLLGTPGNDMISGGAGSDLLIGGEGDDVFLIIGSDSGYDRFQGDAGFDQVQGGDGDDLIRVNNFSGRYTVEKIDGGQGVNILVGTAFNDIINLAGTELVNIASVDGGVGNDSLTGSAGNDVIIGAAGSDLLAGGEGDDVFLINGSYSGYDRFQGDAGYDPMPLS